MLAAMRGCLVPNWAALRGNWWKKRSLFTMSRNLSFAQKYWKRSDILFQALVFFFFFLDYNRWLTVCMLLPEIVCLVVCEAEIFGLFFSISSLHRTTKVVKLIHKHCVYATAVYGRTFFSYIMIHIANQFLKSGIMLNLRWCAYWSIYPTLNVKYDHRENVSYLLAVWV